MKYLLLSLLLILNGGSQAFPMSPQDDAQTPTAARTFRNLQTCVGKVLKRFSGEKNEAKKLSDSINANANLITDKWMNASNKQVPSDYLKTLGVDCTLLDQAVTVKDSETALALLRDVSDDLDIKAKQAKSPVAASEVLGASIMVTVKTRRNGKDVEGYLVRCNPRRYPTRSPAMFVFTNPTNQAKRSVPPGNYIMWLETQNGQFVVSRPITIGGNGEDSEPPIVFDVQ